MSELISGKEAKIAWANGLVVQVDIGGGVFGDITSEDLLSVFDYTTNKFRLKPRTIRLNGIEVPSPFEPKYDEKIWILSDMHNNGYMVSKHKNDFSYAFGVWRTEEEIKQVVAALRKVFKGE